MIVVLGVKEGMYEFEVRNTIKAGSPHAESSGIGLASCRKIMESHGGEFLYSKKDDIFLTCIRLPGKQIEFGFDSSEA